MFLQSFLTCSVTTGCMALGEEAGDSGGPGQWSHWRETEQQTRGLNQDCNMSVKSANVQANAICQKILFFIGIGICYFSK